MTCPDRNTILSQGGHTHTHAHTHPPPPPLCVPTKQATSPRPELARVLEVGDPALVLVKLAAQLKQICKGGRGGGGRYQGAGVGVGKGRADFGKSKIIID